MLWVRLQNFPLLQRDLTGEDAPKQLKKHLEKTAKECGHLSVMQLLILPIQRIPRCVHASAQPLVRLCSTSINDH